MAGIAWPDILAPDFDAEKIAHSLASVPDRGLGDALLDQHLVAGIGNIFKSEVCFVCGVNPFRLVGSLSQEELEDYLNRLEEAKRRDHRRIASEELREEASP